MRGKHHDDCQAAIARTFIRFFCNKYRDKPGLETPKERGSW